LPDEAPRAGDRFPWLHLKLSEDGESKDIFDQLDDTRFTLIVIGQPTPADCAAGFGDLLRILTVPNDSENEKELEAAKIPKMCFYLVRPDGYVGLCGVRLDAAEVTRYTSEVLRLRLVSQR